jgi:serine/threonine protein kinase/tetratricopeptide (TPR) repeat protein
MAELTPERWRRIDDLFQEAADMAPEDRAAFLEREAAGDEDLRKTVSAMLEGLTGNLIAPAIEAAIIEFKGPGVLPDSFEGQRVGAYQVFECIGKGGMGTVYRATRAEAGFEQKVAMKILHPGIAGGRLAHRFYAERRILSSLEHPHIARLIDGGEHDGLPYLVMEYADGVPVHHYCRDQRLDTQQKLELFRKICQAVQHAHQRLIVHSDLKPSNILVLADGTPKLLDFGIAKLLDPAVLDDGPLTETGWRPMTPEFASPEQIRGEAITVASDVYSLGVILFLLLTGDRPYQLKNHSAAEVEQIIGTAPVPVPSTMVKEDTRLRRLLQGDLDNILLMALRKEPERRYQSVEQFSEDIRRHLAGQTVIARPDTVTYRVQKFVRRNRLAVVLTAALVVTAGVGGFLTIREGRRAQNRFREVRALSMKVLTDFDAEARKLAGNQKLRQVMVDESLRYLDSLAAEASGDATLQQELALAYHRIADIQGYARISNLGRRDLAMLYHQKGLAIEEELRRRHGDNPELLKSMAIGYARLSDVYARAGKPAEADEVLEKAVALAKPDDPSTFVPTRIQMARRRAMVGDNVASLRYLEEAQGPADAWGELSYRMLLRVERSETLQLMGRPEASLAAAREGLAIADKNRDKNAGDVMFARRESFLWSHVAAALGSPGVISLGRWCEAIPHKEKALAMRPYDSTEGPLKAGLGLELLQTQALCGKGLNAALVKEVQGWLGGHAEGLAELEQALAVDEFAHGKKAAARARMLALAEQWKGAAGFGALEILADFAWADGQRVKAWEYLRKARELREPSLTENSYFLFTRRFQMAQNLARAMQWGDPDPGLRTALRRVVGTWPEWKLAGELEAIRRMASE